MKPILIHLHLYYKDMLTEMLSYIGNISKYDYDLYVTVVEYDKDIEKQIKAFNDKAHIIQVANRGFDVWPFVKVLQCVNLDDYSYVIKIHTKRDMFIGASVNCHDVSGSAHRKLLLDFMSSESKFNKCMKSFKKKANLGMVSNYRLIVSEEPWNQECYDNSVKFVEQLGYSSAKFAYIAGTMFMVRAKLLHPLLSLNLKEEYFAPSERDIKSLAHDMERFLGHIIVAQGYNIDDCITPPSKRKGPYTPPNLIFRILHFIYSKKITKNNKMLIKFCKIPIYSKKL